MKEENEAVTILVPSLALLLYGLAEGVFMPEARGSWDLPMFLVAVLTGIGMFGAYFATMRLYELTDLAAAEFPTLFASILIQPLECAFMGETFRESYFIASVLFVATIYAIMRWQSQEASHA
jgi:drug/metabolite transporter (DMT)-like permease